MYILQHSFLPFQCFSKNNRDGAKSLEILEDAFDSSIVEEVPDDGEICIKVRNLFVSDAVNFPLKSISTDIYKGKINTLIGEKKSGATALTSVLTGERIVIIWKNYAYITKTTTNFIGSTRSSSGSIYYNGENILKNLTNFKRSIGLCSEENSLFSYLSVSDHLSFYAKVSGKVIFVN